MVPSPRLNLLIMMLALFLSGAAGLINQVVWQRALKLFLGGSETISAMVVVLVFMLGLGVGSLFMGFRIRRVKDPCRLLMWTELLLVVVNLGVAWLLSRELGDSVYGFQRFALSVGVPISLVYAVGALVLLLVPCFLMGITLPLASETSQRQLGATRSSVVDVLFAVNTAGAVLGAYSSGFYLLPNFGQRAALIGAAGCNAVAALVLVVLWVAVRRAGVAAPRPGADTGPTPRAGLVALLRGGIKREEILGLFLGFLSLAYEMLLMRLFSLAHLPRPYTFSFVICAFLLTWSVGVFLASRLKPRIGLHLFLVALLIVGLPFYHAFVREFFNRFGILWSGAPYFLPCVGFGILFGQVIRSFVKNWGQDVGRYSGLNTVGSCAGILVMTMVGFELHYEHTAYLIAIGFCLVLTYHLWPRSGPVRIVVRAGAAGMTVLAAVLVIDATDQPKTVNGRTTWCGRDGVIETDDHGNLAWDGLWHSSLVRNDNHIFSNNWSLAVIPAACHSGRITDALVIGLGTGITAATLAKLDTIGTVDVYEINHTLEPLLRDDPEGTMGVATNPRINLMWRDGRSGMALSTRQYDLITQQPLWLMQAGSSILLSREYMQLVSSRLKPGGVFAIYCGSATPEQALVVRKTAASVFRYGESFGDGYCLVVSNDPVRYSEAETHRRAKSGTDEFWSELRDHPIKMKHDSPRLEWEDCPVIITDDHPIVEYTEELVRIVREQKKSPSK